MTREEKMELLREWVKSEVDEGIAGSRPGEDGYYGAGRAERERSERLFEELCSEIFNVTKQG